MHQCWSSPHQVCYTAQPLCRPIQEERGYLEAVLSKLLSPPVLFDHLPMLLKAPGRPLPLHQWQHKVDYRGGGQPSPSMKERRERSFSPPQYWKLHYFWPFSGWPYMQKCLYQTRSTKIREAGEQGQYSGFQSLHQPQHRREGPEIFLIAHIQIYFCHQSLQFFQFKFKGI